MNRKAHLRFNPKALDEILEIERHGDPGATRELARLFLRATAEALGELEVAFAGRQHEVIEHIAHNLRSSSLALGLEWVGAICANMEINARNLVCHERDRSLLGREFILAKEEVEDFLARLPFLLLQPSDAPTPEAETSRRA